MFCACNKNCVAECCLRKCCKGKSCSVFNIEISWCGKSCNNVCFTQIWFSIKSRCILSWYCRKSIFSRLVKTTNWKSDECIAANNFCWAIIDRHATAQNFESLRLSNICECEFVCVCIKSHNFRCWKLFCYRNIACCNIICIKNKILVWNRCDFNFMNTFFKVCYSQVVFFCKDRCVVVNNDFIFRIFNFSPSEQVFWCVPNNAVFVNATKTNNFKAFWTKWIKQENSVFALTFSNCDNRYIISSCFNKIKNKRLLTCNIHENFVYANFEFCRICWITPRKCLSLFVENQIGWAFKVFELIKLCKIWIWITVYSVRFDSNLLNILRRSDFIEVCRQIFCNNLAVNFNIVWTCIARWRPNKFVCCCFIVKANRGFKFLSFFNNLNNKVCRFVANSCFNLSWTCSNCNKFVVWGNNNNSCVTCWKHNIFRTTWRHRNIWRICFTNFHNNRRGFAKLDFLNSALTWSKNHAWAKQN